MSGLVTGRQNIQGSRTLIPTHPNRPKFNHLFVDAVSGLIDQQKYLLVLCKKRTWQYLSKQLIRHKDLVETL